MADVLPFRAKPTRKRPGKRAKGDGELTPLGALDLIHEASVDGVFTVASRSELARVLKWERTRTSKALDRWAANGAILLDETAPEKILIRVMPDRAEKSRGQGSGISRVKSPVKKRSKKRETSRPPPRENAPAEDREITPREHRESVLENSAFSKTKLGIENFTDQPSAASAIPPQKSAATSENATVSNAEIPPGFTHPEAPPTPQKNASEGEPMSTPVTDTETLPKAPDAAHHSPLQRPENRDLVHGVEHPAWRRTGGGGGGTGGSFSAARHTALDVLAVLSAISLAGITAWLSVNGMVVLFPGLPIVALLLGVAIEGSKITTSAWLGRHWHDAAWVSRVALIGFTAMCAMLNAASVYSQLVQAHIGARGTLETTTATRNADAAGRIEVQQDRLSDLDKRIGQIDATISEATKRGRTKDALRSIDQQRQSRATLSKERDQAAGELANLKTRRVETSAQSKAAEVESTPLRYLAEILNINAGPEALIRFLIAAIVACGDPFAIALLAAVSGRRRRWA
jgi:hypothetical protein